MFPALNVTDLDSLDPSALKASILEQHERYNRALSSRATGIDRLTLLVAKLQHRLFGRKSERVLRQIERPSSRSKILVVASAIHQTEAFENCSRNDWQAWQPAFPMNPASRASSGQRSTV